MLIYKGLFTLVIIIVAILSSTPLMTTLPDKKNIIKPKATPKKLTGANSKSSIIGQQVTTSITVSKKKMTFERKEQGREPIVSSFILNSEGQFIEDDNSEGQNITSFFGIEAQDLPLNEIEGDKKKVSTDYDIQVKFQRTLNTTFQNNDLLTDRCVHLFTQSVVTDQLGGISRANPENESRVAPESNPYSRTSYMKPGRTIDSRC